MFGRHGAGELAQRCTHTDVVLMVVVHNNSASFLGELGLLGAQLMTFYSIIATLLTYKI